MEPDPNDDTEPGVPSTSAPSRRIGGVPVLVVVGAVALGALGAGLFFGLRGDDEPAPVTIAGAITVEGYRNISETSSGSCVGRNGFDDIKKGAGVTITDAGGRTIGTGRLAEGGAINAVNGRACVLGFTAENVAASDFYGVEVSSRGVVTFNAADVAEGASGVQLTLGG